MTKEEAVSLREYLDTRIAEIEKREKASGEATEARFQAVDRSTALAFAALDKATALAASAVEKRLESMNEFRQQLNDQASHFVTRVEIDDKMNAATATHGEYDRRLQMLEQKKLDVTVHEALDMRLQAVEQATANIQGRMVAIGASIGAFTVLIEVALHFLK